MSSTRQPTNQINPIRGSGWFRTSNDDQTSTDYVQMSNISPFHQIGMFTLLVIQLDATSLERCWQQIAYRQTRLDFVAFSVFGAVLTRLGEKLLQPTPMRLCQPRHRPQLRSCLYHPKGKWRRQAWYFQNESIDLQFAGRDHASPYIGAQTFKSAPPGNSSWYQILTLDFTRVFQVPESWSAANFLDDYVLHVTLSYETTNSNYNHDVASVRRPFQSLIPLLKDFQSKFNDIRLHEYGCSGVCKLRAWTHLSSVFYLSKLRSHIPTVSFAARHIVVDFLIVRSRYCCLRSLRPLWVLHSRSSGSHISLTPKFWHLTMRYVLSPSLLHLVYNSGWIVCRLNSSG